MGPDNMSPMDAFSFFDAITEASMPLLGNQTFKIASFNPRRVALIFTSPCTAALIALSTKATGIVGNGIIINSAAPTIILNQADHGPLVALDWFAITATAQTITIFEAVLNTWPSKYNSPKRRRGVPIPDMG